MITRISITFIIIFFSLNLNATNIRVVDLDFLINKNSEIKKFIKKIESDQKKHREKYAKEELNLNNSRIIKISNTNYRVYFGPYDNLKSLKKAFDDINPLNFENIEIIKL